MKFSKLHAAGNSILAVEGKRELISPALASRLLDPKRGVGADNLLLYEIDPPGELDCYIEGFNVDGTPVGLCANGGRCLTWHLFAHHGLEPEGLRFNMQMNQVPLQTEICSIEEQLCAIEVPAPKFAPSEIPFTGSESSGVLKVGGEPFEYGVVNVGNPHCVLFLDEPVTFEIAQKFGSLLESDTERFPDKVNVEFCCFDEDRQEIELTVFERATGITTSSGSGSMAAVTAVRKFKQGGPEILVRMSGGEQRVIWEGGTQPIRAEIAVRSVCEGTFSSELLESR